MSRAWIVGVFVACGILLVSSAAGAQQPQEDRTFGLTASYPGSGGTIGIVWQKSARTAFRPEFFFSDRFAGENAGANSWSAGIAVTVLRYIARKDRVSTYWGPRFSYSRVSSSGSLSNGSVTSTAASVYGAGAGIGVQYDPSRNIGVYAEVGGAYTYQRTTYSGLGAPPSTTVHNIASRGSLGLNVYF